MRKLILHCGLALGDIVMLTAAVRDLHRCYPGRFQTDVRTACPDLWQHNPFLTRLRDDDPEVERIDCSYPLINHANKAPYHCLHGFIDFLNSRLGLSIRPTAFQGDIHLSPQEMAWYSQVHEVTGADTSFWIVAAGGKYDVTIKWWAPERFQAVIDHFQGKIQFVQIGAAGHHHPRLQGVIDLRGRTGLRELIRLVYHAQGVLCPVTGLMHLAAAVPVKPRRGPRACVVLGGAREPAHWEAYPHHQFIHTNGALPCAHNGGCWRDRTLPLRDGDQRDRPENLCRDVVGTLPRCMDLITAADVVRRIEHYFLGGALKYLSNKDREASKRGIRATAKNPFDLQALNLHSAALACDRFLETVPPYPGAYARRGIVICGGGPRYCPGLWVCIQILRHLGCRLPIEVWHLGPREMNPAMKRLLAGCNVRCIDALRVRHRNPMRILNGWELKAYALLHSSFREALLLDADNVPVANPEYLFDTPQYRKAGAVFWPDYSTGRNPKARPAWRSCGLRQPHEPEFESGQVLMDKQRCWRALNLAVWLNANSDFFYQFIHGDKETFRLAFRKVKQPYALVPVPIHSLGATMCQHDFNGRRLFQHRNGAKWSLTRPNPVINDFWFEDQCRKFLKALKPRLITH